MFNSDDFIEGMGCLGVIVQLNYDEVRDIANTCYYATEFIPADQTKIRSNAGIAANMTKFLFDMVKYGNIQLETI